MKDPDSSFPMVPRNVEVCTTGRGFLTFPIHNLIELTAMGVLKIPDRVTVLLETVQGWVLLAPELTSIEQSCAASKVYYEGKLIVTVPLTGTSSVLKSVGNPELSVVRSKSI